jgi:hypothetical protein
LTIVIEPAHDFESLEAVTWFPVRLQVSGDPVEAAWNASLTRPGLNTVGWPRSAGGGENVFSNGATIASAFGQETSA